MKAVTGHYIVALDKEGSYERAITSSDMISAVEEWAEWVCQQISEWTPFECFAKNRGDTDWMWFEVSVEMTPSYHAEIVYRSTS